MNAHDKWLEEGLDPPDPIDDDASRDMAREREESDTL